MEETKRVSLSRAQREIVKAKYDGRCAYCGEILKAMHVDHLIPIARAHMHRGVEVNCLENLMPSCPSCNNYKMSFDLEGFRRELERQVERGRTHSLNFRLAERFGLIKVIETKVEFYFEKRRKSGESEK